MHYASGPGFDSRWQLNIFNPVFKKKPVKEREYIERVKEG